jgi:hypothetical protein
MKGSLGVNDLVRRWLTASALAMLAVLALAACGAVSRATNPTGTTASTKRGEGASAGTTSFAGCPGTGTFVVQSMNGTLSSCLRVGNSSPGSYHVVLDQIAPATRSPGSAPSRVGPAVVLSVSPTSGPPGTTVTVRGTLPFAPTHRAGHANLCWHGCRDGLQYSGVPLRWTSAVTFEASLVVPGAAWIEAGPDRVAELSSGTYPIGVECLPAVPEGCAGTQAQGSTRFRLVVPSSRKAQCPTPSSCAHLAVSPKRALPGDVVSVRGFAPLVSVIGADQPFAFQLQVVRGPPTGPEVRFSTANAKGFVMLYLGHAALAVQRPPSFAGLGHLTPVSEVVDGLAPIAADPSHPSTLAWCSGGGIVVQTHTGQLTIPTQGAAAVLERMGFGLLGAATPRCVAVAPLGTAPGGAPSVLGAAFVVAPNGQAPPAADVAIISANGGRSWAPLPVPPGAAPDTFGGFRPHAGTFEALFAPSTAPSGHLRAVPLVEVASPSERSWQPGRFSCPTRGPCVSFGPYEPGNCAMNGTAQGVLRSGDGGHNWAQPPWPTAVQACAPAELVATSNSTELLIDSESPYTLRRSTDGGATWADIGLPPLPGEQPGAGLGPGPAGITVLADGSLLATGARANTRSWELLRPGATSWCPVRGLAAGVQRSAAFAQVILIGDQLWWLSGTDGPAPTAHHLSAVGLSC